MKNRKLFHFLLILLAAVHIIHINPDKVLADTQSVPQLAAPSAILMESSRKQILYEKDASRRVQAAIANKIMTTLLAVEKTKMDAKVTVSKTAAAVKSPMLELEAGKKYLLEDLLYAVMLTPSNDASMAVAEHIGGEVEAFVDLMNDRAEELGLSDTHFTNPTGLFDEEQYTSAQDLARLVGYALSQPLFNRYFSSKGAPWNDEQNPQLLLNRNELFWSYDGVDGGKVGFHEKGKQAAVTTATRNGLRLIAVIVDSLEKNIFTDTTVLLDYGFQNYKSGLLVQKGMRMKTVQVGSIDVNLVSASDVYYTFPTGKNNIRDIQINLQKDIKLPVEKGKTLGIITYTLDDGTKINVDLQSDKEVTLPESRLDRFRKKLKENIDLFVLIGFLLLIEVMLMLYYLGKLIRKLFAGLSRSR